MTALLVIVLGSIFAGWATPTESGGPSAYSARCFIAALNKRTDVQDDERSRSTRPAAPTGWCS